MDAQNAANISQNIQNSLKSDSSKEPQSSLDYQPIKPTQLDQLVATLQQLAQTQAALTQAVDYLIGQNQQLIELVIQQQEIDKPDYSDSLDG